MIPIIEYSLFQRFSLDEAANKRPRGVLPMMVYRGRLCPKGVSFSRKMVYEKGKGLDPGVKPPRKNICWVPSPPGKRQGKMADYTRSQWKVWWSNTNTETLIWRALILQWWERTLANPTNVTLLQSWRRRHMLVDFVIGSLLCSERFFGSRFSGLLLSSKTNNPKFGLEYTDIFLRVQKKKVLL